MAWPEWEITSPAMTGSCTALRLPSSLGLLAQAALNDLQE